MHRHRLAEKPPLSVLDSPFAQELCLRLGLHALGDHFQVQGFRHLNDMQRNLTGRRIEVHRVDEGLVDLEEIQLKTLQERQTGVARAKVINGDANPVGAQFLDDLLRRLGLYEAALTDFDYQITRSSARILDEAAEQSDGALGVQIGRGEIDRDVHPWMTDKQVLNVATDQVDDALRDALHETGILGNRNEQVRPHHLTAPAPPPDQCLGADPSLRAQIHDGLVEHEEIVAFQCRLQHRRHGQLQPRQVQRGNGQYDSGNHADG